MSVKKEPSGRRSVQVEVEVPGTPEEVWQAIATGSGISSWFVPTEIRDDGSVVSHFGPGMDGVAMRTAWEPPHRFAAESQDMGPGAPALATEWIVEARSGGTCVVRVVHSLFASSDDWDNQLEGVEAGWPGFFRILQLYLAHFRGQPCSIFHVVTMTSEPLSEAWDALTGSLGLTGATAGQQRSATAGASRMAGLVEWGSDPEDSPQVLLRLDEPTPGIAHLFAFAMGGQVCIATRFYLYGDAAPAAVARNEPLWQKWIHERFPFTSS